jgi:tetratricopeptide (TPR) repeat protein
MRRASKAWLAACAVTVTLAACAAAFMPDWRARAPTLDGFGTVGMRVTTAVPAAQDAFSRGLLQAYAFNHNEAQRAFKAAVARDPHCAMCAWGVAYALGPNINRVERGDLGEARSYLVLARRNAANATAREVALIDAMAARLGEAGSDAAAGGPPGADICRGGGSASADPLDLAYAQRMRVLADANPRDPDITVLYAEAAMISIRGHWWNRKTGEPARGISDMTARLETALAANPQHTGLNHYLIHAVDHSPQPQRGAAAADRLGKLAPASPHLLHMPSHIYVRVARYDDAVRVNTEALAAQVRQNSNLEAQGFARADNWNAHNVHFLWFAALMAGRGELALDQARRFGQGGSDPASPYHQYARSLPLLTLLRLERWGDVLNEPALAARPGIDSAVMHYARGVALVRQGDRGGAESEAKALKATRDVPALAGKKIGDDPIRAVLDIFVARLDAEIAAAEGRTDLVRANLARGIALEAGLDFDEPPMLGAGSQLVLGDLLLRAGQSREAEKAFRSALEEHPGSGWALRGLHAALARNGDAAAARQVQADLARAWGKADASLLRAP